MAAMLKNGMRKVTLHVAEGVRFEAVDGVDDETGKSFLVFYPFGANVPIMRVEVPFKKWSYTSKPLTDGPFKLFRGNKNTQVITIKAERS